MTPPDPHFGPCPGAPPGGKKVQIFVPTGRVIKYPKKCALFGPPGGTPRGPQVGYPPGIPPSNSKNRLFGPKMGPFLGPWRGPGGGPGGRPGGGPAGGPRGAPGGARGAPRGGPRGGPWRGSWRGSRRGRRLGPSWTPVWGHLRWRMHQGLPANQMHVVMPQSSDTLMAALRSTLATGLATPCRPMLGDLRSRGALTGRC